MSEGLDRRGAIAAAAAMTLAGAARAQGGSGTTDAEAAFRRALASGADGRFDVEARLAFLATDAVVVADDVPYPLDRAGYADHLRFARDQWDSVEIALTDVRVTGEGGTAVVSAFYNLRGKPKDAGFRLRPGYCTAVCTREAGGWRALSLHMAPLSAQILDASPS